MDLRQDNEASKDPAVEKAVLSFDEDDFEGKHVLIYLPKTKIS